MTMFLDYVLWSLVSLSATALGTSARLDVAVLYVCLWQAMAWLFSSWQDVRQALVLQAWALFLATIVATTWWKIPKSIWLVLTPVVLVAAPVGCVVGEYFIASSTRLALANLLILVYAILEINKRHLFPCKMVKRFQSCWTSRHGSQEDSTTDDDSSSEDLFSVENSSGVGETTSKQTILDRYDFGKQLGEGAFGVVREATSIQTGRLFAIKIVDRSKLLEEEQEKLGQEITLMQQYSHHPDIVRLVHVDLDNGNGCCHLILEHMKDGDLYERLVQVARFSERDSRRILNSVLQALAFLHSHQVVHRDIKPENILLADNKVKLADFGLAKPISSPMTLLKTVCGTLPYVACEMLQEQPAYTEQVDVWSLGVVAYTCLAGYHPFRGQDEASIELAIQKASLNFEEEYWSKTSSPAKDLIAVMLKADPSERLTAEQALRHAWFDGKEADGWDENKKTRDEWDVEAASSNKSETESDVDSDRNSQLWTALACLASSLAGGFCGIHSPPLMLYYFFSRRLGVNQTFEKQIYEGLALASAFVRLVYYLLTSAVVASGTSNDKDWVLYFCVMVSSVIGALLGKHLSTSA